MKRELKTLILTALMTLPAANSARAQGRKNSVQLPKSKLAVNALKAVPRRTDKTLTPKAPEQLIETGVAETLETDEKTGLKNLQAGEFNSFDPKEAGMIVNPANPLDASANLDRVFDNNLAASVKETFSVSAPSEADALSHPRFAPDGPDAEEYGASKGLWGRVDYLSSQTFL